MATTSISPTDNRRRVYREWLFEIMPTGRRAGSRTRIGSSRRHRARRPAVQAFWRSRRSAPRFPCRLHGRACLDLTCPALAPTYRGAAHGLMGAWVLAEWQPNMPSIVPPSVHCLLCPRGGAMSSAGIGEIPLYVPLPSLRFGLFTPWQRFSSWVCPFSPNAAL